MKKIIAEELSVDEAEITVRHPLRTIWERIP